MTAQLAFRCCYADWKLIKTRGVVQVVMEIPLADADAAYKVLGGMPDSASEVWFAVAPLKLPSAEKEKSAPSEKEPATPEVAYDKPPLPAKREKMDWCQLQPAAQCGIRCDDEVFRKFLRDEHGLDVSNEEDAAKAIRSWCNIKSRSELSTNHKARVLWHSLDEHFLAWKHVDA